MLDIYAYTKALFTSVLICTFLVILFHVCRYFSEISHCTAPLHKSTCCFSKLYSWTEPAEQTSLTRLYLCHSLEEISAQFYAKFNVFPQQLLCPWFNLLTSYMVTWQSGKMSVFDRRTFPVLCLTGDHLRE